MRFRIIFQSLNTLSQKQKEATEKVTIGIPHIESEPNSLLSSELVPLNLFGRRFKICQLRICSVHFRIHLYI